MAAIIIRRKEVDDNMSSQINWNKSTIDKMNKQVEKIANSNSSDSAKAQRIVAEGKKIGVDYKPNEIKKMLSKGAYPKFDV